MKTNVFRGRQAGLILGLLAGFVAGISARAARAAESSATESGSQLVADALRAEVEGNLAGRRVLLSVAMDAHPDYEPARWQSGQIEVDGEWMTAEQAQQIAANEPRRIEYQVLRRAASDSLDDQLQLARWCDQHQLADEARFHWSNVLAHQPNHAEALRATDSCWYQGQRMTYAEVKSAKERALAAKQAARQYRPLLARWTRLLDAGDVRSRDAALAEIRTNTKLAAIPAFEEVTLESQLETNAEFERTLQFGLAFVAALEKQPDQAATDSLLRHAAAAPVESVRDAAAAALRRRSPYGFVPQLLALLTMPFESSFRITTDDEGGVHYWHSLYREGRDANLSIESRNSLIQHDFRGATVFVGEAGPMGVAKESDSAISRRKARAAERSHTIYASLAASTEQQVARLNAEATSTNSRVTTLLGNVTEQDLGDDLMAWWDWWDKYNEYASDGERPTQEQRVRQHAV